MEWLWIIAPVASIAIVIILVWKVKGEIVSNILAIAKPVTTVIEKIVPDNGSLLDKLTRWAKIAVVNMEVMYRNAKEATTKGTEERDKLNEEIEDHAVKLMKELAGVDNQSIPSHVENAARAIVKYEVEAFLKPLQSQGVPVLVVEEETEPIAATQEIKETPTLQVPLDPLESTQPTE